jgi:hypothetical protein
MEDNLDLRWRKASYSGNGGGDCVEVGNASAAVLVRDTKQAATGPVLKFSADVWRRFSAEAKRSLASAPEPGSTDICKGHSRVSARVPHTLVLAGLVAALARELGRQDDVRCRIRVEC